MTQPACSNLRRRRAWYGWRLAVAGVLGSGLLASCGSGHHQPSSLPTTSGGVGSTGSTTVTSPSASAAGGASGDAGSITAGGPPPIPPPGAAYLGAWVNPVKARGAASGGSGNVAGPELRQLPAVEAAVGRPLGLLQVYSKWSAPAPLAALRAVAQTGAVPVLSWGCAPVATIASGEDDALITAYARALGAYGKPVFLRWFWEMNLLQINKNKVCIGSSGAAGFVSAWQHIRALFRDAGATNVAFVWCPGLGAGSAETASYFPGASYVDWIGADGYDRAGTGALAFGRVFGTFYAEYAGFAKPLMVGETGAKGADQAAYVTSLGSVIPARFPAIKALVYFDAPAANGSWALQGTGLTAFAALSHSSYFSYRA